MHKLAHQTNSKGYVWTRMRYVYPYFYQKLNTLCMLVRPAILYETKCWADKNQTRTRQDKIRNENIREFWGSTYSRKDGEK